jgi:hypothetical protein
MTSYPFSRQILQADIFQKDRVFGDFQRFFMNLRYDKESNTFIRGVDDIPKKRDIVPFQGEMVHARQNQAEMISPTTFFSLSYRHLLEDIDFSVSNG